MSDIVAGETFIDGQSVSGARLNNDLSSAVIDPSFVSGKSAISPVTGDYLLVLRTSDATLKKSLISSLLSLAGAGTVTSVGLTLPGIFTVTGSPVIASGTLTAVLANQTANTIFAGPTSGGVGVPGFRPPVPADSVIASIAIAASAVDWSLSNTFYKGLTGNSTFTFSNFADGRSIVIRIQGNGFSATWPGYVKWPGGSQPVQSANTDVWNFVDINGTIYGSRNANYF